MMIFLERNVSGFVAVEWFYDTDTSTISSFSTDNLHQYWPADGTVLFTECDNGDKITYTYVTTPTPDHSISSFNPDNLQITTVSDSPDCCTLIAGDYTVTKVNNTNAISPNGSIDISSSHNMTLYEVSIDGGGSWGALPITGLSGGSYSVLLRLTGTSCFLTFSTVLIDTFDTGGGGDTPPPITATLSVQIVQTPDEFSPVFLPITYQFQFTNNTFTIKSDGRAYIDPGSNPDLVTFLSTLPYIRIVGSTNYNGNTKVTDVDNPTTPTKFYISPLTYVSDELVQFIPIDRQIFQLFGETDFNVFDKIADISVAADTDGIYYMRIEGFLQSLFEVLQPSTSDDLSLGRKYYCIPRDYDLDLGSDEINPILTAVFGTQSLVAFLDDLVPLGTTPINFIDSEGAGYPTIFSFLNQENQRVTNVISGASNTIVTGNTSVIIQALPGNTYTIQWVSPTSFSPVFVPDLPDWITILEQTSTSITLQIETFSISALGDYLGGDYSALDYSVDQLNSIVGCYTFLMYDGTPGSDDQPIFTLTTCIFPTQLLQNICGPNLFNIAWVNLYGGWNSYIFKGVKKHGRDVSTVTQYKKVHELKKSSVQEVYDTVEVGYAMKGINEIAFITDLRTSIQAYLFNDVTQFWDIPIIIDKSSFPTYQTPFRQGDQVGSFTFRYADEILVQRQ